VCVCFLETRAGNKPSSSLPRKEITSQKRHAKTLADRDKDSCQCSKILGKGTHCTQGPSFFAFIKCVLLRRQRREENIQPSRSRFVTSSLGVGNLHEAGQKSTPWVLPTPTHFSSLPLGLHCYHLGSNNFLIGHCPPASFLIHAAFHKAVQNLPQAPCSLQNQFNLHHTCFDLALSFNPYHTC
jgi:hypothetical protein